MASTLPKVLTSAVGRRKTSTAAVRLISGKGEVTVNGKPASQYFSSDVAKRFLLPLQISGVGNKYDVIVRVSGGGHTGQLDATTLGISRAIVSINEKYKKDLRSQGLMTRDSRKRQRRMVGMGGKSRRAKQSPKR